MLSHTWLDIPALSTTVQNGMACSGFQAVMRGWGQVNVSVDQAEGEVPNYFQVILNHKPVTELIKAIRPLISDALVRAGHGDMGWYLTRHRRKSSKLKKCYNTV
jgi:hypothetical protein